MPSDAADRVRFGRIGRPHGLRGAVHVQFPQGLGIQLHPGMTIAVGDDDVMQTIATVRQSATGAVVTFEGIASREGADAIRGAACAFADRAAAEGTVLAMLGWSARSASGEHLGTVDAIYPMPAHPVLGIRRGGEELLVPLTEPFIVSRDSGNREIVILPIEGLFDPESIPESD